MALPKLANYPTFDLVIPSTKRKIQVRPFIVSEQKVLLMALETKSEATILGAIANAIQACILTPGVSVKGLTTFDVEYIFIQLRAKSVGERAVVNLMCGPCRGTNSIQVDVEKITVDVPAAPKFDIKLDDKYTLRMRYPKYQAMLLSTGKQMKTAADQYYSEMVECMDRLITDEEDIKFDDEPREEVDKFLENLLASQFKQIQQFVDSVPKVSHPADFTCTHCGHHNKYTLQGISDFF